MSTIKFETVLRPCIVNGERALFHCWTSSSGIVEFTDGSVKSVEPESIRFVDTDDYLDDIIWPEG